MAIDKCWFLIAEVRNKTNSTPSASEIRDHPRHPRSKSDPPTPTSIFENQIPTQRYPRRFHDRRLQRGLVFEVCHLRNIWKLECEISPRMPARVRNPNHQTSLHSSSGDLPPPPPKAAPPIQVIETPRPLCSYEPIREFPVANFLSRISLPLQVNFASMLPFPARSP